MLKNHINDPDARKALADDLFDIFSHHKPKETPAQLSLKAQTQSEFEACLFLCFVDQAKRGSAPWVRNSAPIPSKKLGTCLANTVGTRTPPRLPPAQIE